VPSLPLFSPPLGDADRSFLWQRRAVFFFLPEGGETGSLLSFVDRSLSFLFFSETPSSPAFFLPEKVAHSKVR